MSGLQRRISTASRRQTGCAAPSTRGSVVLSLPLLAALPVALLVVMVWLASGCAGGGGSATRNTGQEHAPAANRPGTVPTALELLAVHENRREASYFPLESPAGVAYGQDGTLIFTDEKRGRVFGFDRRLQSWFEFDHPGSLPYHPVDVRVAGFKVMVLDRAAREMFRFDLGGAYQDRLINFGTVDPGYQTMPTAFDVDVDGRLAVTDGAEQQVLLFDSFLNLNQRVAEPGMHDDQLSDPSGIVFTRDGGFLVADRGNRRLQVYNRMGFFAAVIGGDFDPTNPFLSPQGLDIDAYGNVFVADPVAGVVHVLDPRGRLLLTGGSELPLATMFEAPVDVATGPDDLLAVTDRGRPAIYVFRVRYE